MASLASRYALVTGANRGLGLEWTRHLAPTVDRLFATCRRPEEAETLRDVGMLINKTMDRSSVMNMILDQLQYVLEYSNASIQLLDNDIW